MGRPCQLFYGAPPGKLGTPGYQCGKLRFITQILNLLLILAVAGGVFAQEITWSGSVATGFVIQFGDSYKDPLNTDKAEGYDKDKSLVQVKADDDDVGTGVQARLNAAITDENWGIEFGLGADIGANVWEDRLKSGLDYEYGGWKSTTPTPGTPAASKDFTLKPYLSDSVFMYNAHGWMNFVDGMLKIRAGLIDPGVWTTQGPEDWNLSSGLGVRFEVMPMEGFNAGIFLSYGDSKSGPLRVGDFFQETAIGASYSMEEMMGLYFSVAFKLKSTYAGHADYYSYEAGPPPGWKYYKDMMEKPKKDDDAKNKGDLIVGFGMNPIEPLTVKVEARIFNLGDTYTEANGLMKNKGTQVMWFNEDVSYEIMEGFNAGILLSQLMGNEKTGGFKDDDFGYDFHKMALLFKPYATYVIMEGLTANIEIPVWMDSGIDVDAIPAKVKTKDASLMLKSIGADLGIKYDVSDNASVKFGYGFTSTTKNFSSATTTDGKAKASLDHYVRLLFNYNF